MVVGRSESCWDSVRWKKTKQKAARDGETPIEATRLLSAMAGSCWKSQLSAGSRREGQVTAGGAKQTRHELWTAEISNLTRQVGLWGGPWSGGVNWHHTLVVFGSLWYNLTFYCLDSHCLHHPHQQSYRSRKSWLTSVHNKRILLTGESYTKSKKMDLKSF